LEELEKLKRKGELLRAAQRRESERTLQKSIPVMNSQKVEEGNKTELLGESFGQVNDYSHKPMKQKRILPSIPIPTRASPVLPAIGTPNQINYSKEQFIERSFPDKFSLDDNGSTMNTNNCESLIESVEDMSTITAEDKDCLTATDIEDFNFNDLAKELQPGVWGKVKISLCGHHLGRSMVHNKQVFQSHLVNWEALCQNPSLVFDDKLVIMTNQRLYPGRVALPLILSTLAFEKPLSGETLALLAMNDPLQKLISEDNEEKIEDEDGEMQNYSMNKSMVLAFEGCERKPSNESTDAHNDNSIDSISGDNLGEEKKVKGETSVSQTETSADDGCKYLVPQDNEKIGSDPCVPKLEEDESYSWLSTFWLNKSQKRKGRRRKHQIDTNNSVETEKIKHGEFKEKNKATTKSERKGKKRSIKTLKPTSEMLQSLGLQPGENQIEFVVNSALQGRQSVKASIWLWRSDDKIVVSDVDGTITKSDVMGHCMPWVGNAWCHEGVARYYSDIEDNGYRIMYLTSRSVGHAAITREYLFNQIEQTGHRGNLEFLPSGPVIMAPDSLFTAVNREIIQRNPQQFKIPALQGVKKLFPTGYQPYAAAFGNRKSDLIAYDSVDIPIERVFIIDGSGAMRTANRDYNVTYPILDKIVDAMFPSKCLPAYTECNDLLHWNQEYIADPDDLSSLSECEEH